MSKQRKSTILANIDNDFISLDIFLDIMYLIDIIDEEIYALLTYESIDNSLNEVIDMNLQQLEEKYGKDNLLAFYNSLYSITSIEYMSYRSFIHYEFELSDFLTYMKGISNEF